MTVRHSPEHCDSPDDDAPTLLPAESRSRTRSGPGFLRNLRVQANRSPTDEDDWTSGLANAQPWEECLIRRGLTVLLRGKLQVEGGGGQEGLDCVVQPTKLRP